ncbi:uncharacterized protein VTP21DRAFT_670 [Calcarisporiella thermophila]|uniref:uncharacterized protein n=1 Tax=Calcarisporiella thermophila TaxID=911321 RepID=UPI003741EEAD
MTIANTTSSLPHTHESADLLPFISDSLLSVFLPVVAYWVYSLMYELLDYCNFSFLEPFRIHTPEELKKNRVSKGKVVWWVFLQQVLQAMLALALTSGVEETGVNQGATLAWHQAWIAKSVGTLGMEAYLTSMLNGPAVEQLARWMYWYVEPAVRFFVAMFILDAYQYFLHRLFHTNKFLYKHLHSVHHRLYVPYAYGALYNHPIEGFVMDSVGGGLAYFLSGMTVKSAAIFFTFSTIKTVDDHSGYDFPWNPLQLFFNNNAKYHDIHHQPVGIKANFSQPFFTLWDRLLGTYAPTLEACREANLRRKKEKDSGSESEQSRKDQ